MAYHLVVNRLSRLHERMRNAVRLHQTRAQSDKHLSDHRLAGGNASGQTNFQHPASRRKAFTTETPFDLAQGKLRHEETLSCSLPGFLRASVSLWWIFSFENQARDSSGTRFPRRIFAAFTVLNINIAMVSGPTPPGTGVRAPTIAATSGCTSPISVEPFLRKASSRFASPAKKRWNSAGSVMAFIPTSMTVAPGLTKSRVIMPARPIAATRMSARRHTPGRSCV